MLKAWRNPSGRSHPRKLGTSGTYPNFPLSYTPKGRGHLLIKEKPPKYSFLATAPVSHMWKKGKKSSYALWLLRALAAKGPTVSKIWSVLQYYVSSSGSIFPVQLTSRRIGNHTRLICPICWMKVMSPYSQIHTSPIGRIHYCSIGRFVWQGRDAH